MIRYDKVLDAVSSLRVDEKNLGRETLSPALFRIMGKLVSSLYTAASWSERIAFNTLNRKTGNRAKREFVDSETGDPVERDDRVKGYEIENGQYIVLEPDEVAAAVPESDKTPNVNFRFELIRIFTWR